MQTFSQIKKNLKKEFSGLEKIKVAVLGDSATQFLVQALRGMAYEYKLDLDIWEADFNQIERQTLDPSSELHQTNSDFIIVFQSTHNYSTNTIN